MDAFLRCFAVDAGCHPFNKSDSDEAQATSEKCGLIAQETESEKRSQHREDDEKVKEYDDSEPFKQIDTSEDDDDDGELQNDDDDEFSESKTHTFNLTKIQTDDVPFFKDTESTATVSSVDTAGYNTWETSLLHMDSFASNFTPATDNTCADCIHLQHMQKQLEIQIKTLRERNNELEDNVVDAQTSEENIKSMYDGLKEDIDRIKSKYQLLMKSTEESKVKHENALHEMHNKFENDMQNMEKHYQETTREKNAIELTLNETHEKLAKLESDLMNSQNAFSTLNVQKLRLEEDLKIQQTKMESVMKQHAEKLDLMQKERNHLLATIKQQTTRAMTEKENNELTSSILKDQIQSLHGEIAELEEEKKALQESVALYETQMQMQLIATTSLNVDENDSDNDGIPEEQEMNHITDIIYADIDRRKSHNMSISELEPAFYKLPFKASASDEVDDDDSVYINYDIESHKNKNVHELAPIKSNSPLLKVTSSPHAQLPLIPVNTPPLYDLNDEDSFDIDDIDMNVTRNKRAHSRSKGDPSLSVIAEFKMGRTKAARSVGDLMSARLSPSVVARAKRFKHSYSTSVTSQTLNVWKNRYTELKSETTSNAKQAAQKDIELSALRDKMQLLEAVIDEDVRKIESLTSDLENMQHAYIQLHVNEDKLRKEHEIEVNELNKELNAGRDEIATLSTENERYLEYRNEKEKENKKKDKLHTKQLKFNEELMNEIFDLNNEVKQLTDMNLEVKSRLESLLLENAQAIDDYESMKRKLSKNVRECKEGQKEHTRLKNKVSSLNKEVLSLNQTITDLENLFSEHSNLLMHKNKRINRLGKQREAQQQSIHKLSTKLKKRERHMKGYLLAEENSFKKSHNAKDKRINMLRETNKKLVTKVEEAEKKILELKSGLRETKNKFKEEIENKRMTNKALHVEISKLIADHNKLVMQKQEMEYDKDRAVKINEELMEEMKRNEENLKRNIQSMVNLENNYCDVLMFLDSMQIKEDALYKFVDRCRNTLINTNKLTNKLTIQLIEGCDRAICVYYNTVSYFKLFIDKCLNVKQRFKNIERSHRSLEFHCYEIYQSALCSIYNIGGSSSAASNVVLNKRDSNRLRTRDSRDSVNMMRSTRKILNPKNKDVIPKIPLIAKDLIRKPVQSETVKVPIAAYHQIHDLLSKHIENALKDLRNVTENYSKPLNVSIYNEENEEKEILQFDDEIEINWNKLSRDPATERVFPGLKERNDKRFEQIMMQFNTSSKQFRSQQTKQLMQLDGAWHQYNIAVGPNNDLSPKLSSKFTTASADAYKMSSIHETESNIHSYVSPLTLKVSSQGMHSKRYSIF